MSFYNYPQVVPHLVEDVNLKRARIDTDDSIRVTTTNGDVDLTDITDTLGDVTDTSTDPTIVGLMKAENADVGSIKGVVGTTSDTSSDSTVIGLLKSIASKLQ